MTTPLHGAATAQDLLFGGLASAPVDVLVAKLYERGCVRRLIPGLPELAITGERQVASATAELLSSNIVDVVAAGWMKYRDLRQIAERSVHSPVVREVVAVAPHDIRAAEHLSVDLHVDGTPIATITIELELDFRMDGVHAVVRKGRLVEIHSGTCTVSGCLRAQQVAIARRRRALDLPGAVRLRKGVSLIDPTANPVPRTVASSRGGTHAKRCCAEPREPANGRR